MVQLDHFDSGNTITPENDDTCEVRVLPAASSFVLPHPTPKPLAAAPLLS